VTVCGGRVCRGRICVQSQGNSWDPLGLLGTYLALGPVSNCNTESIKRQPVDVMAKLTLQIATFFRVHVTAVKGAHDKLPLKQPRRRAKRVSI
jgi:hypothetical protein